jgi:gliding motility-associated-like protein
MRNFYTLFFLLSTSLLSAQIPCNGNFLTVGSAVNQGSCIQLTPNQTNQQGCAWLNTPVNFSQPFTHEMVANFGSNDPNGADGICLVYQANNTAVCGGAGIGIGAAGIPNSFIVEFDTWDNGAASGDIPDDHCAVNVNGNMQAPVFGPVSLGNIEDGLNHTITFSWNPVGNAFVVSFDGAVVLSGNYDIINNCFGGSNQAFWGYTASTGGASNAHVICPTLPPPVIADAGPIATIPCIGVQTTLDGSASDMGAEFAYSWSTIGGNIVSGGNTLFPVVNAPGIYTLTLTNTSNGCIATSQTNVFVDPLVANIATPPLITCNQASFFLDGSASSSGPFISYQWTSPDGIMLSGFNSPILEIGSPGTFTLTVTYSDGVSFCTEQVTVQVFPDPNVPIANAFGGQVSCLTPEIQLSGAGSSTGSLYAYQWSTLDGQILQGGNTLFPTIGAPGIYTLTVINVNTGCEAEASVLVTADDEPPLAAATVSGALGCQTPQLTLNGTASSQGSSYAYSWTTSNGNIVSGANTLTPVVDQPGLYILTVTNQVNGCSDATSVTVTAGPTSLDVSIQPPALLTCDFPQLILDGTDSEQGPGFLYNWFTADGLIVADTNTLTPTIGAPGTYLLTVTNPADGCTGEATVQVSQNATIPAVDAGDDLVLSCGEASLLLDGSSSAQGAVFAYQWSSPNGNILSGQASLMPLIDAPGVYILQVTDTGNGCTAIDSVQISSNDDAPALVLSVGDTLNCSISQTAIDASGSAQGPAFSYAWSTPNGNFVSLQDSLNVLVDAPGQYTLTITNLDNDCASTATVTVREDVQQPLAAIALPDTLDCATAEVMLDGAASSQGNLYAYQWSTPDGLILAGAQSLAATAGAPGQYELLVTNLENTCTATAAITVYQDTLAPSAQIAPPAELNCLLTVQPLDASGSSQGAPFVFSWSTASGSFLSGIDNLTPLIDAPGEYTLEIVNTQNSCQQAVSVTVGQDTIRPIAAAGGERVLNCDFPSLQLDGGLSSQAGPFAYSWTGEAGQAIAGANTLMPTVSQPGIYQLEVVNTANGCRAADEAVVSADFAAPEVSIALPDTLTCVNASVVLDGSGSSSGSSFAYTWSTADGSILSGGGTPQAVASQAGTYLLEVVNTTNGCRVSSSVEVAQDTGFPIAQVAPPLPLNCERIAVVLDAGASSQGSNFVFDWTTVEGNITTGQQSLTPTVDAPGLYILRLLNLSNDCEAVASVEVLMDTLAPLADAGAAQVLNCAAPSAMLDGGASSQGSQYLYQWSSADGNIMTGADGLAPLADAPGTYQLLVTNTENGCSQTAFTTLSADFAAPGIAIAAPELLTCIQTAVQLDASGSDANPAITYLWTSPTGQITTGVATPTPVVTAPGAYTLQLFNQDNGCADSLTVQVLQDIARPIAAIASPAVLTCAVESILLDGAASSSGPLFSYAWQAGAGGSIIGGAAATAAEVDAPGPYTLIVTNDENGCRDTAQATVAQNIAPPSVQIANPSPLTCAITAVSLDGTGSSAGAVFQYQWATTDGSILGNSDGIAAVAAAPGTYTLTIQDLANGCSAAQSVAVLQDIEPPVAMIADPGILTCAVETLALDANASSTGPGFALQWATDDGQILSGPASPTPQISAPGTYTLVVLNQSNGCSASAEVQVAQDTAAPIAAIAAPEQLDCRQETVVLDAAASSAGNLYQYQWTGSSGAIPAGADPLALTVAAPGSYTLSVLNLENGCSADAAVTVGQDTLRPLARISPPEELNCIVATAALDGSLSSSGPVYQYQWSTVGGLLLSPTDGPQAVAGAPGDYTLAILNTANGCTAEAAVTVSQDIEPPIARAGEDFILPCFETLRQLDGSGSSAGLGFAYQWQTSDGALLSGSGTLSPSIGAPGLYRLVVTNLMNGCQAADEVAVTQDIPTAVFSLAQPPCAGDLGSISVESLAGGLPPYLFSLDGGESFQQSPVFLGVPPGAYELVVQDVNGCEYREQQAIEQPDSLVVLVLEPEVTVRLGESHQIQVQLNVPSSELAWVSWGNAPGLSCDDCLDPIATLTQSSVFLLRVRSLNGCEDEARVRLLVDRRPDVYIPNAFSPNGDGANDVFMVFARASSVAQVRTFSVFNRWGEEVFSAAGFAPNDPQYGWDGIFRGQPMNAAVLVYYAEIEFVDGSTEIFKGEVNLLR